MEEIRRVTKKHAYGFMDFIREQGVVGLAIGIVIGGAVTVLAKSLMDNVVMPPVGYILGSAEGIKGLSVSLGKTAGGKDAIVHYGVFLNDLINFVILAVIIYLVVHALGLDRRFSKKKDEEKREESKPQEPKVVKNAKKASKKT